MEKDTWTPEQSAAEIWRLLKEVAASQKRTDAEIEKLVAANAAIAAERKKEAAKREKEAAKEAAEWKKIKDELAADRKDTEERFNKYLATHEEVNKQLAGIGISLGGLAEDFFYANAPYAMEKEGFRIDSYNRNVACNKESNGEQENREYDIIGVNGDYVVVIEVKARLKKKHINEFTNLLPYFVKDFPEHKGKKIYGGIAGMSLGIKRKDKEEIEQALEENGLFLLTQTESNAAELRAPGNNIASLKNFG